MKRRIFTIVSALSLLLCVATTVLWIKSFWKGNGIGYTVYTYSGPSLANRLIWDAEIICGSIIFGHAQTTLDQSGDIEASRFLTHGFYIYSPQPRYAYVTDLPRTTLSNHLGFFVMTNQGRGRGSFTRLLVPCWFVALLSAVLPVVWVSRHGRWRRESLSRQGRCPECGYDLRASKERCPECGAPVIAAGAKK